MEASGHKLRTLVKSTVAVRHLALPVPVSGVRNLALGLWSLAFELAEDPYAKSVNTWLVGSLSRKSSERQTTIFQDESTGVTNFRAALTASSKDVG